MKIVAFGGLYWGPHVWLLASELMGLLLSAAFMARRQQPKTSELIKKSNLTTPNTESWCMILGLRSPAFFGCCRGVGTFACFPGTTASETQAS